MCNISSFVLLAGCLDELLSGFIVQIHASYLVQKIRQVRYIIGSL
jgi:hypothetical protein